MRWEDGLSGHQEAERKPSFVSRRLSSLPNHGRGDAGRAHGPHPCSLLLQYVHHSPGNSKRGFGIDCAILSCQVYISQILVASALGGVVDAVGTVRVIPMVASVGSFLGFLTATFLVIYPEVSEDAKDEQKGLSSQPLGEGGSEKPTVLRLTRKVGPQGPVETESMV